MLAAVLTVAFVVALVIVIASIDQMVHDIREGVMRRKELDEWLAEFGEYPDVDELRGN